LSVNCSWPAGVTRNSIRAGAVPGLVKAKKPVMFQPIQTDPPADGIVAGHFGWWSLLSRQRA